MRDQAATVCGAELTAGEAGTLSGAAIDQMFTLDLSINELRV